MFNSIPLLTILAVLPLLGALVLVFTKGHVGKLVGLGFSLTTLVVGLLAFVLSRSGALIESTPWIRPIGAYYALEFSGMSAILVLLTVILVPAVFIAEWNVDETPGARWSTRSFFAMALAMQGLALFVFMASDVLLFYIAFEATLIPMYFMIAGWGGARRGPAAMKFLLYSLAGGLVMLVAVAGLYAVGAEQGQVSFLFSDLAALDLSGTVGKWLFVGFFFAFAVKAPLAGLHTWLPDAAEQASPGSTTLLVGVLDKIGTFGMIKVCLMVFPEASAWATPAILIWAIVSVVYGAFMAMGSRDLLRFVSYTSVSHFGFMVFGIFAMTTQSLSGSIFYMLNHGLSSAALFLVVGYLVRRRGTADISAFGGVQKLAPVLAGFLLIAGLATLSLPGFGSFVGEFFTMAGAWQRYPIQTAVITIGMVLSAVYVLTMYQRTMTGPVTPQAAETIVTDLDIREKAAVVPLIILMLALGFFPAPLLGVADETSVAVMSSSGVSDPAPLLEEGN